MWVSLHQHSQFSILDASCSVEAIANKASEYQMPALALTDHGNMYGVIDFYQACQKAGVKPIFGCEVYVAPGLRTDRKKDDKGKSAYHLILLAKDQVGYHNLCCLCSKGFLEGFYYNPRIDKELLQKHSEGLVCLSGCLGSSVSMAAQQKDPAILEDEIRWFHNLFGQDYYLELQRHRMSVEQENLLSEPWLKQAYNEMVTKQDLVNEKLIAAANQFKIPLVATNDVHYIEQSDWQAHEILLNIQTGEPVEIWEVDSYGNQRFRIPNPKRRVYPSRECYFKSPQQMAELFSDQPEAISNSVKIAEKCNLEIDFQKKHYPVYIPPSLDGKTFTTQERTQESEAFLRKLCEEGIPKRYTPEVLAVVQEKYPDKEPMELVRSRLEEELEIITSKGMCDYLLIVWDLIHWAKSQNIPVGPGRGSGAGSIILYLIAITDIEPLRFSLFFERFINPERISYPDIDVDICMSRRSELIDYAVHKYGKDNVAQIITFGSMKAKMTIKDVGRVLSVPLAKVNAIAKLVPEELNMTLVKALDIDPDLNEMYTNDEDAKRIIDLGKRLEGSIRNTSIHAAGIIISSEPLTNHIPICIAKDAEMAATQYSMKPVEAVGMLKMDLLGLKTLTSITTAVEAIEVECGKKIDWTSLALDDAKTFQLLQEGKTLGVFQMESGGMQELAKQLVPDRFEEIIAMGALYRPGPMEMIPTFVNRKHKREPIEYEHPWMESILSETYGIMVYQEQVMQIASRLANYSLGEGDVLRKAMGKKQVEQMAKERDKFRKGVLENNLPEELATQVFDKIEKFAAYGFNKAHAAGYGYLTYVTAYLKANYPMQWLAALMTCDRDDLSKVGKFIREAQGMNISILPPSVNKSGRKFTATPEGIRFALTGIKGVGEQVVDSIIEERQKNGPFETFYSFFKRNDLKRVGKKAIESLAHAGSFDFTGWKREELVQSIEPMFDQAQREQKEDKAGVISLFTLIKDEKKDRFAEPPEVKIAPSKNEILIREKELLGFFLTGHPMDSYRQLMKRLSCVELGQINNLSDNCVIRTAFLIEQMQVKIASKSQRKFAILRISDKLDSFELPIWPELYEQKHLHLLENKMIYAVIQLDHKDGALRMNCRWLDDLTKANESMMTEADQAFDRAKLMQHKSQQMLAYKKQNDKKADKQMPKDVLIELDLSQLTLSRVLKLKEVLNQHAGSCPLQLLFKTEHRKKGTLFLDAKCGVTDGPEFTKALDALDFVERASSVS